MGAVESSSLENIGSLSSALEKIEEKLTRIENAHLHHEARICHDDMIVICDKRIICRPNVQLVLGPILGLVTQESVKVMVEVDCAAEIFLHVFRMDPLMQGGEFSHVEILKMKPFEPGVATVTRLSPGTRYAIYVGGVHPRDALKQYAVFETFPSNPHEHRVMFTHDSQADRVLPGEEDLWIHLEANVSKRVVERFAHTGSHHVSSDSLYNHNTPVMDEDSRRDVKGVHQVVHVGNFLSVDRFLRTTSLQLLHEICNDDVAVDVWKDLVARAESRLRDHYRRTLTDSPSVRRSFRLCGHIFLCGPSEAGGSGLDDLFATLHSATSSGPPVDEANLLTNTDRDKVTQEESKGAKDDSENKINSAEKMWDSVGEAARSERELKHASAVRLTRDQQQVAKLIHGMLLRVARRVQAAYLRQLWDDNYVAFKEYDAEENERHYMMLQSLKSLQGRRHLVMRMEKSYKLLSERNEDSKDHAALTRFKKDLNRLHEEVLALDNLLTNLYHEGSMSAERNKGAMLSNVSPLYVGGETLLIIFDSLWSEVILPSGFPASSPIGDKDPDLPLVELEINQKFYEKLINTLADDSSGMYKPTSQGDESVLNESNYEIATSSRISGVNIVDNLTNETAKISNIIIISFRNLISAAVNSYDPGPSFFNGQCVSESIGSRVQQSGNLCVADRFKLLNIISEWKERGSGRNCLVACAVDPDHAAARKSSRRSRTFAVGWTMSYAEGLRFGQKKNPNFDLSTKTEARLQYLLVSGMSSRKVGTAENCKVGSAFYQDALLVAALSEENNDTSQHRRKLMDEEWAEAGHLASVRSLSQPDENGFLIVSSGSYVDKPPITSPTSINRINDRLTSLIIDTPAVQFHTTYISPHRMSSTLPDSVKNSSISYLRIVLGPVVGAITPTSVTIMCEYYIGGQNVMESGAVAGGRVKKEAMATVTLIDQISGVEFVCRKSVTSRKAFVFSFNNLIESRSYVVQALVSDMYNKVPSGISGSSLVGSVSTSQQIVNAHIGSFTTPCAVPPHVLAEEWHQQTLSRMRGRSAKPVVNQVTALTIIDMTNTFVSRILMECSKATAIRLFDELKSSTQHQEIVMTDKEDVADEGAEEQKGDKIVSSDKTVSNLAIVGQSGSNSKKQLAYDQEKARQVGFLARQYLQQQLSARRIIILGSNQPSWRKHLSEGMYNGDLDALTKEHPNDNLSQGKNIPMRHEVISPYSADLAHLVHGDALCRVVGNICQEPWSGIDLVLHCGGSVDISISLQDAMSNLARAEILFGIIGGRNEDEFDRLMSLAEDQLRDAYRWHWSSSLTSTNFGHGSHLFCCSSALIDLLSATHYSSLCNLINDYSKFCVESVLKILEKLESEYQRILWKSASSHIEIFANENKFIHFLDSGTVCLFQLCPQVDFSTDLYSPDLLIVTQHQLDLLNQTLREGNIRASTFPRVRGNTNGLSHQLPLTSLIILSPVQIFFPTETNTDVPSESSKHNLKYANGFIQSLLDIITNWIVNSLCPDLEKEVIFVCPSSNSIGQSTRVKGFIPDYINAQLNNDPDPLAPFSNRTPDVEFLQLCCGPSVSVASTSFPSQDYKQNLEYNQTNDFDDEEGLNIPENTLGFEHSKANIPITYQYPIYTTMGRVFICSVESFTTEPHCGMIYVGGDVTERKKRRHDIEQNKKLPEDERHVIENLEFSDVISFLKLEDSFKLEMYLSNTDEHRIPIVVQDSWNAVKDILEGVSPPQTASFEVKMIFKAVNGVSRRCEGIFAKCFSIFQSYSFGGGVMYNSLKNNMINYQHNVEANRCSSGITTMLLNIFNWLLKELPHHLKSIFPLPSPFVMKRFWIYFTNKYCLEMFAHISQDRDTTVSLNEVALLNLHTDYNLYNKLCCDGLRCLALFVQISEEHGLSSHDKW